MKKFIATLSLLIFFLLPASNAFAFCPTCNVCSTGGSSSTVCTAKQGDNNIYGAGGIIDQIINIFSIVIGIVAVFAIIVAGFILITSGGESSKVASAKNTIIYVVVGLVVVAIAQIIEAFVINNIGS